MDGFFTTVALAPLAKWKEMPLEDLESQCISCARLVWLKELPVACSVSRFNVSSCAFGPTIPTHLAEAPRVPV